MDAPRLVGLLLSGFMALSACTTVPSVTPAGTVSPSSESVTPSGETLAQEQLEQLLAPIALYPDALLAQVLMASTYPLEIVQAARWRKENMTLEGKALEDALPSQPWDPSVKSLTAFPPVLEMMNEQLAWTQQLGDAFLADQKRLLATTQKLRNAANTQGNLKTTAEQTVIIEPGTSESYIRIEPANPAVVYVPAYDPSYVYGAWPYPAYPPYYYYPPGYYPGAAFWTFTAGIIVGGALWGSCNWRGGDVHIEHHKYNNFNRSNISGDRSNWKHNADHRRGVPYKDQRVAQQFNRGSSARDAQARQSFRGRSDGAALDRGEPGPGRDGVANRDLSGGRQASGFGGSDDGRRSRDYGSRGMSSRQGMSSGGFGGGRMGGGRGGRR
ncbi:MAG: DUF3300 domain-containing protein [Candidatus Accumulibacter meliphilus]|jgi:hypothetical protein|uniref:DUF3300 domain-containing protein n=1 Tax=Candidatus Accumulibacter meliphilus TaxID=2211374 RepID=UPI002FC2F3AF